MMFRAIVVILLALLAALFVVRVAFVDAFAKRDPSRAATIWPGHPSVILAAGLEQVGKAAAEGKPVDPATIQHMLAVSTKAPLAPEPYLVRGVEQQLAGKEAIAEQAFIAARRRDPRSLPARYFLADHYLRTGQTRNGLDELAALTRLVPQSLYEIAPQLAAYARTPGALADVKALLREQPQLEPLLLNVLASNPNDSRLALALWSGQSREADRGWQQQLVIKLIEAGRFGEARAAWQRFNPAASRQGELVDPMFVGDTLPPFGWTLASGASGVVEPEGGGRLHIRYYGRDDQVLASQTLMLRPGPYRLSMRVSGASPAAKSLAWIVRCLPSKEQIALAGFDSARGALVADFSVPSNNCTAQSLELAGAAPELPEQADLSIWQLRLVRRRGDG